MSLLLGSVISGISVGLLYGLLAFAIVLVYKSTGLANFAQGNMGTLGAFIIYLFAARMGLSLWVSLALGAVCALGLGLASYYVAIRPRDGVEGLNLTIRTLALYLILFGIMNRFLSAGQPFTFPHLFPNGSVNFGAASIPISSLGTLVVASVLSAIFGLFFLRAPYGVALRALAQDAEASAILGVNVRTMTAVVWAVSGLLGVVAAVLTAPTALLSTDMMDLILPFAFTGAVIGGLSSLPGALVGGVLTGVIGNTVAVYATADIALYAVFGLMLATLLLKPDGIFGSSVQERL